MPIVLTDVQHGEDIGKQLSTKVGLACLIRRMKKRSLSINHDQGKMIIINQLSSLAQNKNENLSRLRVNENMIKYCLKRLNHEMTRPSNYTPSCILQFKPQQMELFADLGCEYFLKDRPVCERTQAYETSRPSVILSRKQALSQQLGPIISSLANSRDGGFILICQSYSYSIIKAGLTFFTPKDQQKLKTNIKDQLKSIYFHHKIEINAQGMPIYDDLQGILSQQSKEFVLKITVRAKPPSSGFFFIEQTFPNTKSHFSFSSINGCKQHGYQFFQVQCVESYHIYALMQDIAIKKLKSQQIITKTKSVGSNMSFNLKQYISKPVQNIKTQFSFSSTNLLQSLLTALAKLGSQQILQNFQKIGSKKLVVQLQISEKYDYFDTCSRIETFLNESKTKYKCIVPLLQFQKEFLKFRKAEKPNVLVSIVAYYFLDANYNDFVQAARKNFGNQFEDRIVIHEVTEKVSLGASLNPDELQACLNFLWQFFDSIPKMKKEPGYKKGYVMEPNLKNAEFVFPQTDLHVAVFTFFSLTLGRKRPQ